MKTIVLKHGFPDGTDEAEAIRTAIAAAEQDAADQGLVLDPESVVTNIVRTDAHKDAGEYLVRVDALAGDAA